MPNNSRRPTKTRRSGTQSIERAISLLNIVSTRGHSGWRLTDLVDQSGLDDSTVMRIMSSLAALRLVKRKLHDRHYVPGPALYELAVTLTPYFGFQEACHRSLIRISKGTGWAARLYLRSNHHTVQIDRFSAAPIQWFNDLGNRLPLISSSQGIAILLAMPPQQRHSVVRATRNELLSITPPRRTGSYQSIFKRSRKYGFGISLGDALPGRASIGLPILAPSRNPIAAIGVSGALAEFSEARIQFARKLMDGEITRIQAGNEAILRQLDE